MLPCAAIQQPGQSRDNPGPACYDGANRGAARAIRGWVRAPRARTRAVSTTELTTFAALLKRYRVAAGLTQQELAERARLSVRGISNLERGVRRLPQPATIALLAEAEQRRGVALMMLGQDDALQVLEGAIPRAEAVGNLFVLGRALAAAGAPYLARGEWATSLQYRERTERLGDPAEIAFMLCLLGWNVFLRGDWRQARHHCERALALLASSDASLAAAYPLHVPGMLCLAEGDDEAASRYLEESVTLAGRSGDLQALRLAQRGLAEYDVLAGRPDKAQAHLEPLLDRPGLEEGQATELLTVLAWSDLERGDEAAAGTLVQEAIRRATAIHNRVLLAEAWRIGGLVATWQGRWEDAQQAFQAALGLTQAMGYPYEEGRALYEVGVMLTCKGAAQGSSGRHGRRRAKGWRRRWLSSG
jgi:transcriptional regulator with XRE-family HTH domain